MAHKKLPIGLLAVLIIGLIHGLIYLALIPPWQHYDEPTHFEYAWLVANWLRLPQIGEFDPDMRIEVAQSMIDHDFYKGLGDLPDLEAPDGQIPIGGYSQLDEPPVYYLLAAIPVGLLKSLSIDMQLYGARFVSVALLLVSIVGVYGLVCELTTPGSHLRWIIPGGVALLPGYVELMSAVNNDVGATAFMSLLLWGAIRLVKQGWHIWTVVWSGTVMVLCLLTKETVYLALPIWLMAVALSLLRRNWHRVVWIGVGVGIVLLALVSIRWGDAVLWYRATDQAEGTRLIYDTAPLGDAVFAIDMRSTSQGGGGIFHLNQLIPAATVRSLRGQVVTVGAWMWSDEVMNISLPTLTAIKRDGGANQAYYTAEIGIDPTFYSYVASIPEDTYLLLLQLGSKEPDITFNGNLYLDGVVLALGEHPVNESPVWDDSFAETGSWGGVRFTNVVRNGSAEDGGLRVNPWVDRIGSRVIPDNGRPSLLLYSMVDYESSSTYYYKMTGTNLLQTFWGKFAWGHVLLRGDAVYDILTWVTVLGLVGCCAVFWQKTVPYQSSVLGLLSLAFLIVWGVTALRGAIYLFVWPFIPGARYAFPVIGPTMGLLGFGWWSIMQLIGKGLRIKAQYLMIILGFAMLMLDIWSLISIWRYYV